MATKIQVFGSTSAGNSTLIWNESDCILVDCGFSQRYTRECLGELNKQIKDLAGVLITHSHSDHVSESMMKKLLAEKIPVHCYLKVAKALHAKNEPFAEANQKKIVRKFNKNGFTIGSFKIKPFSVPHDSKGGCFGFNIFSKTNETNSKITVATDIGYPKDDFIPNFINSDIIMIECNHDPDMLENSKRPEWLKNRINNLGHLSNDQCAELLKNILIRSDTHPKSIILAHISQECNSNSLAIETVREMLTINKFTGIQLVETFKRKMSEVVSV